MVQRLQNPPHDPNEESQMSRILTLAAAIALALAAGCDRNSSTPPSPKTDTQSSTPAPAAAMGATTSSRNNGAGNSEDNRNGANPHQEQVDPNHAPQRRDFNNNESGAGPKSSETQPRVGNR